MAGYDASREPPDDARAAPAMSRLWWIPGVGAAALAVAAVLSPAIVSDGGAEPYLDFREGGILLYNAAVVSVAVVMQSTSAFTSRRLPLTTLGGMLVSVSLLLQAIVSWHGMEGEIDRRIVEAVMTGLDAGNPRLGIGVWLAIAAGAVLAVVHARAVVFCFREDLRRSIWAR